MDYIVYLEVCQSSVTLSADQPAVTQGMGGGGGVGEGLGRDPSPDRTPSPPWGHCMDSPQATGSPGPHCQKPMTAPRLSLSAAPFRPPIPSPGTPRFTLPRSSPKRSSEPLRAAPSSPRSRAPTHTFLFLGRPGPRREPAPSLPHSAPQPPSRHPLLGAPLRRSPLWKPGEGLA